MVPQHRHQLLRSRRTGLGGKNLTRWGPAMNTSSSSAYGLTTVLTGCMSTEQQDAYVVTFRIEEITQKLRTDDETLLVSASNSGGRKRSCSPEPQYDSTGRRTNTRARRYRETLENERSGLTETALRTIPGYRPPYGYRPPLPTGIKEKVYLPVSDFPRVNFIGQILGPRGSSLKAMKTESGATIVVRGKGSVKEGKGSRGRFARQEEEPLHCFITADSQQKVSRAKDLVQGVIENIVSMSEGQNTRKQQQLRDLAVMNRTFRDDEGQRHGSLSGRFIEHASEDSCDGAGTTKVVVPTGGNTVERFLDSEYDKLMAEIGDCSDRTDVSGARSSGRSCPSFATYRPPPWRHGKGY